MEKCTTSCLMGHCHAVVCVSLSIVCLVLVAYLSSCLWPCPYIATVANKLVYSIEQTSRQCPFSKSLDVILLILLIILLVLVVVFVAFNDAVQLAGSQSQSVSIIPSFLSPRQSYGCPGSLVTITCTAVNLTGLLRVTVQLQNVSTPQFFAFTETGNQVSIGDGITAAPLTNLNGVRVVSITFTSLPSQDFDVTCGTQAVEQAASILVSGG